MNRVKLLSFGLPCLLFPLVSCRLIQYNEPYLRFISERTIEIKKNTPNNDLIIVVEALDPPASGPMEPGIDEYTFGYKSPLPNIKITFGKPVTQLFYPTNAIITAGPDVPNGQYEITIFAQRTKGRLLEKKLTISVVD